MISSMARAILLACVAHGFVAPAPRHGFVAPITRRQVALRAAPITAPIVEKLRDVTEPAARDLAAQYEAADLPSSRTAYVKTSATSGPALVLVHGFDSSALEFRRLLPELERGGRRRALYDVAGWGLTEPTGVDIAAKRAQLREFLAEVVGGDAVLVGRRWARRSASTRSRRASTTSGASRCSTRSASSTARRPCPSSRRGSACACCGPGRCARSRIASRADKSLGTDDAIRVGLLHCERPGWEDDAVAWVNGGGYAISAEVAPALEGRRTLVLWGDSDEILPPKDNVPRSGGPEAGARASDGDVTVRWSAPITIAGLLFFFPLFFMDTFFAISRGFICASRTWPSLTCARPSRPASGEKGPRVG
ncbi:hypothetical protein SO694_0003039 [Aureococcus anophagefferens]|uniref:AB hydrolase-1 domain-containing protein n=1 Tax=Aureococcus anophagefferens TaxID=44056 RepID=A0ABR1FK60_AURAN